MLPPNRFHLLLICAVSLDPCKLRQHYEAFEQLNWPVARVIVGFEQ